MVSATKTDLTAAGKSVSDWPARTHCPFCATLLRKHFDRATPDARTRAVFALRCRDPLPRVGRETLHAYYRHLADHLCFPFQADYCDEVEPLVFDRGVTVLGVLDPSEHGFDTSRGLLCAARVRGRDVRLPLAVLKSADNTANRRLIDDYWHWFWNSQ